MLQLFEKSVFCRVHASSKALSQLKRLEHFLSSASNLLVVEAAAVRKSGQACVSLTWPWTLKPSPPSFLPDH